MKTYKIYPLDCGSMIRERSNLLYQKDPGVKVDVATLSYYVTDGERKILVDTAGEPATGSNHAPYSQRPDQFLEKQLFKIGVDPKDIEMVLFTHVHWDHASNNHLFQNARFCVQKTELQYAVWPIESQVHFYDLPVLFQTKYEALEGNEEVLDGLRVITTPGHTPGSQTVLVQGERKVYALVGDLVSAVEAWEATPRIPNGIHTDLGACFESMKKLAKYSNDVLPTHDLSIIRQSVYR
jgi:glyoxylase-like metal-dependent hydrolase (beta-lactamase superfamily II)